MSANANSVSSLALAAIVLAGCASFEQEDSQTVALATEPNGASCVIRQNGVEVARVETTPAQVSVPLSPAALIVDCERAGYIETQSIVPSSMRTDGPLSGLRRFAATAVDGDAEPIYAPTLAIAMTRDPRLPADLSGLTPIAPVVVERE